MTYNINSICMYLILYNDRQIERVEWSKFDYISWGVKVPLKIYNTGNIAW